MVLSGEEHSSELKGNNGRAEPLLQFCSVGCYWITLPSLFRTDPRDLPDAAQPIHAEQMTLVMPVKTAVAL